MMRAPKVSVLFMSQKPCMCAVLLPASEAVESFDAATA